jgi:hypothetical protein
MKNFIKWLFGINTEDTTKFMVITSDRLEAKRLAKANDMAGFIWELEANSWRKYKHNEPTTDFVTAYREIVRDLLEEYSINPDDLY